MAGHNKQMKSIPFDTLSYAKKLQSAGFTQEQAEIQAETFFEIVQEQLISKQDMYDTERNLKYDIDNVRKDLTTEIDNVRKDLTTEIDNVRKDLTTEIDNVRKDLTTEIDSVRKDLTAEISNVNKDLKIWFGGMLIVAVTIMTGMMTLIVHI